MQITCYRWRQAVIEKVVCGRLHCARLHRCRGWWCSSVTSLTATAKKRFDCSSRMHNGHTSRTRPWRRFMKRLMMFCLFAISLLGVLPEAYAQQIPSQKTFPQFPDGHWECRTCWTDGRCDPIEQGWLDNGNPRSRRLPRHGDLKHREEVWEGGQRGHWMTRVDQRY